MLSSTVTDQFFPFILFPMSFSISFPTCILCALPSYNYGSSTIIRLSMGFVIFIMYLLSIKYCDIQTSFNYALGHMLGYRNKRMSGMFNQRSIAGGMQEKRNRWKERDIRDSFIHSHHNRGNKRIMGVGNLRSRYCTLHIRLRFFTK